MVRRFYLSRAGTCLRASNQFSTAIFFGTNTLYAKYATLDLLLIITGGVRFIYAENALFLVSIESRFEPGYGNINTI